ncbi:MAG: ABC transporter permease [Propioniciclava sp.]
MTTDVAKFRPLDLLRRDPHLSRLTGLLLILLVFFAVAKPGPFTSVRTWQSMAVQFPEYGILALGVMLTMITAGIDLSVVGIANMTAIASASVMLSLAPQGSEVDPTLAILAAVAVSLALGAAAGVLNGILVARIRIPAILVTLGTLELFTGIAIIITEGKPLSGLPSAYSSVVGGRLFGVVPVPLIIFIVVALIVGFLLRRMTYGKKLYMVGTNATAARFSGLNNDGLLILTYMMSGLCASIAGLVMLANYNSAKADYGVTYTLLTVLIVVLGGVNPNGGSGKLIGVVLAIAVLQILSSGLNMFPGISNFYRPLIWGGVLLLVISTSDIGRGWTRRLRRKESQE